MGEWFGQFDRVYDTMKEFLVQADVDRVELALEQFEDKMDESLTTLVEQLVPEPSVRQGWECPKCGRCYAPDVRKCFSCSKYQVTPLWPAQWWGTGTNEYQVVGASIIC